MALTTYRLRAGLLLGLALLLAALPARAEEGAFTGYFAERKYIRVSPAPNTSVVAWVPAGIVLTMTPIDERYAETTYNDVTGYIHYGDVIRTTDAADILSDVTLTTPAPTAKPAEDEPVVAYVAYSDQALAGLSAPQADAVMTQVFPAFTPLAIVARNGDYVRVRVSVDSFCYLYDEGLYELERDLPVTEYEAYVDRAVVLYDKPLAGANVSAILTPPSRMTVTAINGEYVRVSIGGRAGYLLAADIIRAQAQAGESTFARAPLATVLYDAPDAQAYTDAYLPAGTIVEIDSRQNGYARVKASGQYIQEAALEPLVVDKDAQAQYGYWEKDQPLYANTDGILLPAGKTLRANTLIEVSRSVGDYYLLDVDGTLGFVAKTGLMVLSVSQEITPMAAYVSRDVQMMTQPFSFSAPTGVTLTANTHMWLTEESGDFYRVSADGVTGYITKMAVMPLGEDIPVTQSYEVYIDTGAPLLHFPSRAYGTQVASLPENVLVRVAATNGDFYYIQSVLGSGYLARENATTQAQAAQASTPAGAQRYYLFLNKSTRELTIYYADANGNRTERIHKTVTVAIGKQTTPTPSGVFTLGGKERWHYFGPSYSPFAIAYTSGRYLHGPLYRSANETALNEARLEDFGTMATGGCIRMPYDDALWIYYHCMGDTKLEIVSGVAK